MEQLQTLSTEYLKLLLDELEDNIIYISSQELEDPGNIIDNLILQRNEINEELLMR